MLFYSILPSRRNILNKNSLTLILLLLLIPLTLTAQNLSPEDELYLADPNPRFHGEQVKKLQSYLLFYGIDIGTDGLDGWFGKDTHDALLNYQLSKGLEESGRIKIKDFSTPLTWSPHIETFLFSGWPEGPFPGNNYDGEILIPEGDTNFVYSSYFGSLTISASDIERNGYNSFIHSPAKRFLAAFNRNKTSVSVWDVLSGTKIECSIEETAKNTSYQYLPDKHTQFEGDSITWWMDPMKLDYAQLTLVIFFSYQGPHQMDRSLITLSPYI